MKKRVIAALMASAAVLSLAGCSNNGTSSKTNSSTPADSNATSSAADSNATSSVADSSTSDAPAAEEGKVFNIYAWNEEFKGFFEKYYAGTMPLNKDAVDKDGADPVYYDKAPGIPDGVTVNWVINPSNDGVYQQKLDEALFAQADAAADDKIDMFLAEADYIQKYVDSDYTKDVASIGVNMADTMYQYTINACTDTRNGQVKGVSFQCCPSALIYRRSIAKEVLGTEDPAEVQAALSDWDKFNAVAKTAKDAGYYMTASYAETYRVFSNNATSAWVDADNNLQVDAAITQWIEQTKNFMDNGYTLPAGLWDDEKTAQMFADGKTMCFFGPAWYYNFSMGNAQDPEKGCYGDWGIVTGPQAHFWGGTWLLAAEGTDNASMVADIMKAFTVNEDVCYSLIANEAQFTNNSTVNEKYAAEGKGNAFLGGQNDTELFLELAKGIKWENHTQYDQILNEALQPAMLDYFKGNATEEEAWANFYAVVNEKYATIVTP